MKAMKKMVHKEKMTIEKNVHQAALVLKERVMEEKEGVWMRTATIGHGDMEWQTSKQTGDEEKHANKAEEGKRNDVVARLEEESEMKCGGSVVIEGWKVGQDMAQMMKADNQKRQERRMRKRRTEEGEVRRETLELKWDLSG